VKGAQATTAIEGNTLTREEVERVAGHEKLAQSKEYQEREVRNILEAMNQILDQVADDGTRSLITPELIKQFHKGVGKGLGEHFDSIPGRFRTDQRVVGPYRCPQPEHVETLVQRACDWLRIEFRFELNNQSFAEAVIQAVVTHVYLEWIHPFGDGNGRTGRLLEFYILLRAGNPDIASHILSNHYNNTRPEYYRQLAQAGETRDLSSFLAYAIQGYYDGLKEVLNVVGGSQFETAWHRLVYDRFAEKSYRKKTVFKRRRAIALAMPPTKWLTPDEIMVLTSDLARQYGGRTAQTLHRDLKELHEMKILRAQEGRYKINLGLLAPQVPRRLIDERVA